MNITQEELNERVAIIKRFKKLLEEQRNKFKEYLTVLEKQEGKIAEENTDALIAHTELEQQIVKNISSLQHVIEPMQKMYNNVVGTGIPASMAAISGFQTQDVGKIQSDLAALQKKVLIQNEKNRNLLKVHIAKAKSDLENLQKNNPYRGKRSVFAEHPLVQTGSRISFDA